MNYTHFWCVKVSSITFTSQLKIIQSLTTLLTEFYTSQFSKLVDIGTTRVFSFRVFSGCVLRSGIGYRVAVIVIVNIFLERCPPFSLIVKRFFSCGKIT